MVPLSNHWRVDAREGNHGTGVIGANDKPPSQRGRRLFLCREKELTKNPFGYELP
jgi:hypothetical protein